MAGTYIWTSNPAASTHEEEALAIYNAERYRGIVHRPEYDEKMAAIQRRFDHKQQRIVHEDPDDELVFTCPPNCSDWRAHMAGAHQRPK